MSINCLSIHFPSNTCQSSNGTMQSQWRHLLVPIPNPKAQGGNPLIHWDANTWQLSWDSFTQYPESAWSWARLSLAALAKALSPTKKWNSMFLRPENWSEDWVVQARTTLHWLLMELTGGSEPTGRLTNVAISFCAQLGPMGKDPATMHSPACPNPRLFFPGR